MGVWLYNGGQRYSLTDPIGYIGPSRAPVNEVHIFLDGQRYLVWSRNPASLTATSTRWDQVKIDWTAPGAGADSYRLKRGSTQIYAGTLLTFTDTVLMPSTSYTYNLEVIRAGAVVSTTTKTVTTLAYPALGLSAAAAAWNQNNLSWSALNGSADEFLLYRASTLIYQGAGTSYSDTGLSAGTAYTYTLYVRRAGTNIASTTTSVTTSSLPAFGMTATAGQWNYIHTAWTDLGGGWSYWLATSVGDVGWVGGTAYDHTGLTEGAGYNYRVDAYYGGVLYLQAWASATVLVRPTASKSINDGRASYYSYTGATGKTLAAADFNPGVDGYVSSFNLNVAGDTTHGGSGKQGYFDPYINGNRLGYRTVAGTTYPNASWVHVDGGNVSVVNGNNTIGMYTAANSGYWTQWHSYDSNYNSHCTWGTINIWWYTSALRDAELRQSPYWDEAMAEREIHIDSWLGDDGEEVRAIVYDKNTREVLVEWERG